MTTRAEIIAEARTWIGTPWQHQGRLKGVGCDCVGVGIGVPCALGIFPADFNVTGYARNPDPKVLIGYLKQYMDPTDTPTGGDIVLLKPGRIAQHVGLLTFDNTIIHAIDQVRGVREHILDERWRRAIVRGFSYRGIE